MNFRTHYSATLARTALLFLCCLGISFLSGAFASETREDPDEPAHIVTGLMVHDYLTHGLGSPPLAFARDYYIHYPKVAIGHWPPLFYLEQALWTLIFPPTRTYLLCMMALLAAAVASLTYSILRDQHGRVVAWCAALLLLTLPASAAGSTQIMTEIPQTLVILAAMISLSKYLDSAKSKYAVAFGLWSAASLLAKGTGIVLAPLPILAVLLTRRWELLRRPSFWLPALLVLTIAGPWYLGAPSALHEPVARFGGPGLARWRLGFPPFIWVDHFGWVVSCLALAGLLWYVYRSLKGDRFPGVIVTAAALAICGTSFPFFFAVWESRHQAEVSPAFVIMAAAGAAWLFSLKPLDKCSGGLKAVAACLLSAVLCSWNLMHLYRQKSSGYGELAQSIVHDRTGPIHVLLISASPTGEGALISEIAQREPHPRRYILRSTKLLADLTWMGLEVRPRFHATEEVHDYLAGLPLEMVVFDRTTPPRFSYGELLEHAVLSHPEEWQPWAEAPARFHVFLRIGGLTLGPEALHKLMTEISGVPTI